MGQSPTFESGPGIPAVVEVAGGGGGGDGERRGGGGGVGDGVRRGGGGGGGGDGAVLRLPCSWLTMVFPPSCSLIFLNANTIITNPPVMGFKSANSKRLFRGYG